ncbi:MAG: HrgA protein [Treponema sp.]|nr:HrgA protein [Treponema sp.]
MQKQYTFFDLIKDVFEELKTPLSPDEIWEKAIELGFDKKLGSSGKTPSATVGARLYVDVKENGEKSTFVQVSKHPSRFILRGTLKTEEIESKIEKTEEIEIKKNNESNYNERDFHPLLVKYVKENAHFHCYTKTIYQENSVRKVKGANEWLHPDLVGVYFPFGDYSTETTKLQKSMNVNAIKLFSFEMKKHLDYSNLRQCFFQAVSNSSWANEGYLVCLRINNDSDFRNELQRLSNAFGIGIIKLNANDIHDSEIVCPARYNENIDWDTLDRLSEDSPDFRKFISDLTEDIALGKVKSNYDKVISDEKFESYLKDKKIIK